VKYTVVQVEMCPHLATGSVTLPIPPGSNTSCTDDNGSVNVTSLHARDIFSVPLQNQVLLCIQTGFVSSPHQMTGCIVCGQSYNLCCLPWQPSLSFGYIETLQSKRALSTNVKQSNAHS
jgi:hypothetical protein